MLPRSSINCATSLRCGPAVPVKNAPCVACDPMASARRRMPETCTRPEDHNACMPSPPARTTMRFNDFTAGRTGWIIASELTLIARGYNGTSQRRRSGRRGLKTACGTEPGCGAAVMRSPSERISCSASPEPGSSSHAPLAYGMPSVRQGARASARSARTRKSDRPVVVETIGVIGAAPFDGIEDDSVHVDAALHQALFRELDFAGLVEAVAHHQQAGADMPADHRGVRDGEDRRAVDDHQFVMG